MFNTVFKFVCFSCHAAFFFLFLFLVSCHYPLLTTSKRLYLTGWLEITPDPFFLQLPSGYLLDGVTFNHYTYPFAQWKTCHKMAETYVSRPHFEELTLDSGKVHVPARGFRNWALFLQTMCGAAELTSRLFGLPTRQPNSGLTCRLGASPLALASVSKIRH